ncbi:MAG: thiamine pyrophosphate-dependent enzyme [Acetobacteraceae bacterium]
MPRFGSPTTSPHAAPAALPDAPGLAGLGWGLPFAIGAQLAAPDRRVICVAGDGGFAHTWAEIETMKRLKLPVVTLVLNNQILGYQKHAEQVLFGGWTDACEFAAVDHAAIARACGVPRRAHRTRGRHSPPRSRTRLPATNRSCWTS